MRGGLARGWEEALRGALISPQSRGHPWTLPGCRAAPDLRVGSGVGRPEFQSQHQRGRGAAQPPRTQVWGEAPEDDLPLVRCAFLRVLTRSSLCASESSSLFSERTSHTGSGPDSRGRRAGHPGGGKDDYPDTAQPVTLCPSSGPTAAQDTEHAPTRVELRRRVIPTEGGVTGFPESPCVLPRVATREQCMPTHRARPAQPTAHATFFLFVLIIKNCPWWLRW